MVVMNKRRQILDPDMPGRKASSSAVRATCMHESPSLQLLLVLAACSIEMDGSRARAFAPGRHKLPVVFCFCC